jgi:hypothetical protein
LPLFLTQGPSHPPIAPARMSPNHFQHLLHQGRLVIPWLRLVTLRAPRLIQHLAGPPLGNRELPLEILSRRSLPGRAHQFFSATCFSMRLSSVNSATISLRR